MDGLIVVGPPLGGLVACFGRVKETVVDEKPSGEKISPGKIDGQDECSGGND